MANITQTMTQIESAVSSLGVSFSFVALGWAIVVLAAAWLANRLSNRFIQRAVDRRGGDQHAAVTAKKASKYIIYTLGFVVVLGVFGVPLSALGAFVGLIGLGVSFALKDVIANFISGLMILINRPFKIGDQIKAQDESGTVKDIRIRATDIKTFDGRQVIIPNSMLYSDVVINNTRYGHRRFEVIVGIGYDEDIQQAKELAQEVLDEADSVEADPEPQVLVDELGGSSVNLKLRGWTDNRRSDILSGASEVTQLIKDRYDEVGIDIPFPIRTVYMASEDE